jgi:hypothetical protein
MSLPVSAGSWENRAATWVTQHQWLQNKALKTLIHLRCRNYLYSSNLQLGLIQRIGHCRKAVRDLIPIIDSEIIEDEARAPTVVFRSDLLEILNQQTTYLFLDKARNAFTSSYIQGENFNLWELAVDTYSDKKEALRVIASLFQDTSPALVHLDWIQIQIDESKMEPSRLFLANFELLVEVHLILKDWGNYVARKPDSIKLFPESYENLDTVENNQLYHYFVPALMAQKLRDKGNIKEVSFLVPFLLNYLYEILKGKKLLKKAFVEPQNIEGQKTLSDIYMGFAGSFYGAYSEPSNLGASQFVEEIERQPKEFLNDLLEVVGQRSINE